MTPGTTRTSSLVVGLALAATAPGWSQVIDEGVLEIRRGGRLVGEEVFRIERVRHQGVDVTLRSTARYPPKGQAVVFAAVIELDQNGSPVAVQFDQAGPPETKTLIRVHDRRFTVRVLSPTGEQSGDFRRPSRLVLLTDSLFAPYLMAPHPTATAVGLGFDGSQEPQVEVVDEGPVTASFGGREVRAHAFSVRTRAARIDLWYVDNRLIRVALPSRDLTVLRIPDDGQ